VQRGNFRSTFIHGSFQWAALEGVLGLRPARRGARSEPASPARLEFAAVQNLPYRGFPLSILAVARERTLYTTARAQSDWKQVVHRRARDPEPNRGAHPMSESTQPDLCVFLANHWSFTGIGWQMGLESCAQSIADSLTMADYAPAGEDRHQPRRARVRAWSRHITRSSLRACASTSTPTGVEIIGGTFGQPMASMVSGESNLRQLLVGQEDDPPRAWSQRRGVPRRRGDEPPADAAASEARGYKYASLAQCDTWGRHGAPKVESNVIVWEGVDGTRILATPSNRMVFHPPVVTHDIDWLWSDAGRAAVREMTLPGQPPLIIKWTEFGWESLTGKSMNKFDPELFKTLSARFASRRNT
jgi:hypothetical protein